MYKFEKLAAFIVHLVKTLGTHARACKGFTVVCVSVRDADAVNLHVDRYNVGINVLWHDTAQIIKRRDLAIDASVKVMASFCLTWHLNEGTTAELSKF